VFGVLLDLQSILIGLAMLKFQLTPHEHFFNVGIVIALVPFNFKFLIKAKELPSSSKIILETRCSFTLALSDIWV
jgi:hypothetical protein